MSAKDYAGWHIVKRRLEDQATVRYFHERQIWWTALGLNIGFEEDGKGTDWARPVLVLVKFNNSFFYGVPLSTTRKSGRYYMHFEYEGGQSSALLTQMRAFDARRLLRFEGWVGESDFRKIRTNIKTLL